MERLLRHPSTRAAAIGVVAVIVLTTGVAFAASGDSASAVTPAQVRKIAKSVADAEIARLAPRLTVASANSPAVYAQVTGGGGVTTNSRGVVQGNVVHPQPGIYCFTGLRNAPKGGVATLDMNVLGGGSGVDLAQVGVGPFNRCPAGTQAVVATFNPDTGFVDDPFFVVFWF